MRAAPAFNGDGELFAATLKVMEDGAPPPPPSRAMLLIDVEGGQPYWVCAHCHAPRERIAEVRK